MRVRELDSWKYAMKLLSRLYTRSVQAKQAALSTVLEEVLESLIEVGESELKRDA